MRDVYISMILVVVDNQKTKVESKITIRLIRIVITRDRIIGCIFTST